ncbi:DUF4394 domain-containing protein [Nodularia sphaerocarpa]|uniref:DUF4394 domain-containing protein n=1 Tax=Nodularia sphaerocarpa TaxID=137816 RepID=UPI001EFA4C9A|nr:DUF4394 domain-containing protein [Nodularia sphaerocarpa]MDB9374191.1 DUF4394 domain-containing protein [Nodularia sphaerocarpa CS-585]MDB9378101.1 DUF4394 domain-containing protein [Nodularia sphaerocarpa CS-585A2]ULP74825.1 hypothetical protein BDGGKGIB_04496 [Nodularia sphaerocarpa UHCC 0038]
MKLSQLTTVITALLVATIFDVVSVAKQAAAVSLVGLTEDNNLVLFDSNNPSITSTVSVTGVDGSLLGIDRRPANNLIYGLTTTNNLYTINPFTGNASFVSTLSLPFNGGTISGVDFNPVPDRLRVVGGNDQNYRINVETGAVIVDGTLNPGDPNITAAAYTNADNNPATGTTLYTVDDITDALFIQNPPNDGTQVLIGSLGLDISSAAGFDIFTDNGVNTAFLAATPTSASGSNLYTINLDTGAATLVDSITSNQRLIGLTSVVVPEPSVGLGTLLGVGVFALLGRRRKLVR